MEQVEQEFIIRYSLSTNGKTVNYERSVNKNTVIVSEKRLENSDSQLRMKVDILPNLILSSEKPGKCEITHVDAGTNSEFVVWLQMAQLDNRQYDITSLLENALEYDKLEKATPKPGRLYVAKYHKDDKVYRALCLGKSAAGFLVKFVDYGNTEVVNKMFEVPEVGPLIDLKSCPPLAVPLIVKSKPSWPFCYSKKSVGVAHLLSGSKAIVSIDSISDVFPAFTGKITVPTPTAELDLAHVLCKSIKI